MSNDFNKIIITGRLVKDPIKTVIPTQNGDVNLLKFTIANQVYRSDKPNFFDCEYWGKGVEFFAEKLSKGSLILIEGELKQTRWVDKRTNENRYKIVINIQNINFLSFDKGNQSKNQKDDISVSPKNDVDSKLVVKTKDEIVAPPLMDEVDPFSIEEFNTDGYDYESNNNNFENDDNIFS